MFRLWTSAEESADNAWEVSNVQMDLSDSIVL